MRLKRNTREGPDAGFDGGAGAVGPGAGTGAVGPGAFGPGAGTGGAGRVAVGFCRGGVPLGVVATVLSGDGGASRFGVLGGDGLYFGSATSATDP